MSGGDNWQAGDLALCVKIGRWRHVSGNFASGRGMRAGVIASVRKVGVSVGGFATLWLEGWPGESFGDGFNASRFRKITPPKADEFDREVIDLMLGKPVPVEA